MKNLKLFLSIICIFWVSTLKAEEVSRTILVEQAGTLATQLGSDVLTVTNLTISGELNGTDIKALRKMSQLKILDLEAARIVSGGDEYYKTYKTENDHIGQCMFMECENFTKITLPKSIVSIGASAFSKCENLIQIKIFENTTYIGDYAFEYCSSLISVELPDNLTTLGNSVFSYCKSLSTVSLSKNLISIPYLTFGSCENLKTVIMPEKLERIEWGAFSGCYSLISITIPQYVHSINYSAFNFCEKLEVFIVDDKNKSYSSLDGVLFTKDKTVLIRYPEGKSTIYDIPIGTTMIGEGAFASNNFLSTINIPNSVMTIGANAFEYCKQLTNITLSEELTTLKEGCFRNCYELKSITLPNIEGDVFSSSGLTSLIIPDLVEDFPYSFLPHLESLTVGKNVKAISIEFPSTKNVISKVLFLQRQI